MDFQNPYAVVDIALLDLFRNMGLGLIFAVVWAFIVGNTTRLVVDTRQYLPIFILLIPSMILIISIIKSSIALSLGLVGALSIVRFRTPIKEPEELLYLFVAIAIGLGLGANQLVATAIGFLAICIGMLCVSMFSGPGDNRKSTFIDLKFPTDGQILDVAELQKIGDKMKYKFGIKRVNSSNSETEVLINITNFDMADFSTLKSEIDSLYSGVLIAATENARIIT